jgi:two-component system OmpR family response regulator/two-component system response regulator QseB
VLLLDLKMPKVDGLDVLRALKADDTLKTIPVVMLTSSREEQDLIRSYKLGANAYVVKPVDLNELAARLRALVRRAHGQPQDRLSVLDVTLDPAARSVTQAGIPVTLSVREFDLLHALMLNAGRVLSREQLEQHLYSWGQEVESNAIEVHVHHLRRKLGNALIQTVRGVGYALAQHQPKPG